MGFDTSLGIQSLGPPGCLGAWAEDLTQDQGGGESQAGLQQCPAESLMELMVFNSVRASPWDTLGGFIANANISSCI